MRWIRREDGRDGGGSTAELADAFGDPVLFRVWYDDAVGRVYGYLFGRCGGDIEVAEEITQQTFVQAIRHWQAFDGRSDAVTWLCSIARNKLADHYRAQDRQRRRHLRLVVRDIGSAAPAPDRAVGERDAFWFAPFTSCPTSNGRRWSFATSTT